MRIFIRKNLHPDADPYLDPDADLDPVADANLDPDPDADPELDPRGKKSSQKI
jgi:hypothetical protein